MLGNIWEWCSAPGGLDSMDVIGYPYRVFKVGDWNVNNPDHLRANDRYDIRRSAGSRMLDSGLHIIN
jgi:hypothetical protein